MPIDYKASYDCLRDGCEGQNNEGGSDVMHGSRPGDFASATGSFFLRVTLCGCILSERSTARCTMTHVEAALHQPG